MNDEIKIFVSYHKEFPLIKSSILTPIQVGAKDSNLNLGITRDDVGDNISTKNKRLCELTAQYWAWKNVDVEYYGFMHYRRHFIFNDNRKPTDISEITPISRCDENYLHRIGLNDETMKAVIKNYDLILPYPVDVSMWGTYSNELQYGSLRNLHIEDFCKICNIASRISPEYANAIKIYRNSNTTYWYNMFIMTRELFVDYCSWLFGIIEIAEEELDFEGYDDQEQRALAFMAERLLSIYVLQRCLNHKIGRVGHLGITFVRDDNNGNMQLTKKNCSTTDAEEYFIKGARKAYFDGRSMGQKYVLGDIQNKELFEFKYMIKNYKLVFYAAGKYCKELLAWFYEVNWKRPNEIWDVNANNIKNIDGIDVNNPHYINEKNCVFIITTIDRYTSEDIMQKIKDLGAKYIYDLRETMRFVSYEVCNIYG